MIGNTAPRRAQPPHKVAGPPLLPWALALGMLALLSGWTALRPESRLATWTQRAEEAAASLGARERFVLRELEEIEHRRVQQSEVVVVLGSSLLGASLANPRRLEDAIESAWRGEHGTPTPDVLVADLSAPGLHMGLIQGVLDDILDAQPTVLAIEVATIAPAGHPRASMEHADYFVPRVAAGGAQVPRAQAMRALRARWEGVSLMPPREVPGHRPLLPRRGARSRRAGGLARPALRPLGDDGHRT